jgi:hypothetical protein
MLDTTLNSDFLSQLPPELAEMVCSELDIPDIANLRLVSQ